MASFTTLTQPLTSVVQTYPLFSLVASSTVSFLGGVLFPRTYPYARRRSLDIVDTFRDRSFKYRYPDKKREVLRKHPTLRSEIFKKPRRKVTNQRKINRIFEHLFLGAKEGLEESSFTSLGVTHLLYLSEEKAPSIQKEVKLLDLGLESEGFFRLLKVTSFSDFDRKNMATWFQKAFRFLDEGFLDGKILLCCTLGRVRSATIVIAYLMNRFGVDFESAKEFIESKRKIGLDAFTKKYLGDYRVFCTESFPSETVTASTQAYFQARSSLG